MLIKIRERVHYLRRERCIPFSFSAIMEPDNSYGRHFADAVSDGRMKTALPASAMVRESAGHGRWRALRIRRRDGQMPRGNMGICIRGGPMAPA